MSKFTICQEKVALFRGEQYKISIFMGYNFPIGEYSAEKFYFFPRQQKICEKFPHIFTFRSGKFFKIALFWEKIVKISIFWEKIAKIYKFRGKN